MWQFMPATGKYFELKQNAFRDDRRDVLASTRAALDYLQKLYGMFGDWHLALAAYNWGEGSVGRAIAKNQRAGTGTAYTDLNMPMETRFYVPKLQAVKNIVTNPAAFNSKLPLIENHPYFQTVTIRRDIDVALAARRPKCPWTTSRHSTLRQPSGDSGCVAPPDSPAVGQRGSLPGNLATAVDAWQAGLSGGPQYPAPCRCCQARGHDGIGSACYQQYSATGGHPGRLHPIGSPLSPCGTRCHRESGRQRTGHPAPEVVLKRSTVRAGKGESVATIARKYRVSTDTVAQWNKVSASATFKAGQQVVVFLPVTRKAKSVARAPARGKPAAVKPRASKPQKR